MPITHDKTFLRYLSRFKYAIATCFAILIIIGVAQNSFAASQSTPSERIPRPTPFKEKTPGSPYIPSYTEPENQDYLIQWTKELSQPVSRSPVIADVDWVSGQEVIFVTDGPHIYVYHSNGDLYWDTQLEGEVVSEVAVGQVNGGRGQDIVVATTNGVYIFDGEARQRSSIPLSSIMGFSPVLADIDGDLVDEIIIANQHSDTRKGWLNAFNSDGTQVQGWPIEFTNVYPAGAAFYSPAVADINNDGYLEVLVTVWHHNTKHLYAFNSSGVELWSRQNPYFSAPVLCDFDNDGYIETVIAEILHYNNYITPHIYIYDFQGYDVGGWPIELPLREGATYDPIVADMDGDHDIEIAVYASGRTKVFSFSGELLEEYIGLMGYLTIFNIDDDIEQELIGAVDHFHTLQAFDYDNQGDPPLRFPIEDESYQIFGSSAIGDINDDGKLEIIFSASKSSYPYGAIIYCLEKPWSGSSVNRPWAQYRYRPKHTGYYRASMPVPIFDEKHKR